MWIAAQLGLDEKHFWKGGECGVDCVARLIRP